MCSFLVVDPAGCDCRTAVISISDYTGPYKMPLLTSAATLY